MLKELCLRNEKGANFDPKTYQDFQKWLGSGTAVNMAYQLSVHLACMSLNVNTGIQNGNALIYAPGTASANAQGFATLNAVIAEANTLLCKKGKILSDDPDRAYAATLKDALDKGNQNQNFVQSTPCSFSF
jgi:hypothetical protein